MYSHITKIAITTFTCLFISSAYANNRIDQIKKQISSIDNKIQTLRVERQFIQDAGYEIGLPLVNQIDDFFVKKIACDALNILSTDVSNRFNKISSVCFINAPIEAVKISIEYIKTITKLKQNVRQRIEIDGKLQGLQSRKNTLFLQAARYFEAQYPEEFFTNQSPERQILLTDKRPELTQEFKNASSSKWRNYGKGASSCISDPDNSVCIDIKCKAGSLHIGLVGTGGEATSVLQANIDIDKKLFSTPIVLLPQRGSEGLSFQTISEMPLSENAVDNLKSGVAVKLIVNELGKNWIWSLAGSNSNISKLEETCR